jgi:hypothetical protein
MVSDRVYKFYRAHGKKRTAIRQHRRVQHLAHEYRTARIAVGALPRNFGGRNKDVREGL